jgi:hypothetical protein
VQRPRDRGADPAARARDECHPSVELAHDPPSFGLGPNISGAAFAPGARA